MKISVLRQWEWGGVFAACFLALGVPGIACLLLFAVRGRVTAGLLPYIDAICADRAQSGTKAGND